MTVRLATQDGFPVHSSIRRCRTVPLTPELLQMAIGMQGDMEMVGLAEQMRVIIPGLTFATIEGGELISALGIMPVHYGKAMGWMFPSPIATRRQLVYTVREARRHFDIWQQDPCFRRIEVYIRDDRPWRESFARALGMNECFGPMRHFDTAGRSYWVYARIA